mgnify:CR=1 FL=1
MSFLTPSHSRAVQAMVAASVAFSLTAASADAASKPITGKLSKSGYRVVATTAEGQSKTVVAKGRAFKVVPAGKVVVLNLVDAKEH